MRVVSGAGEFEIAVESVELRDEALVLIGKMGVWEAETYLGAGELGHLARVALRPRVLVWLATRPLTVAWRRVRRSTRNGDTTP